MGWRIATGFFLAISVVQTVRLFESPAHAQTKPEPSAELAACAKESDRFYNQVLYLCHSADQSDPNVAKICRP